MTNARDTLFYPLEKGLCDPFSRTARVLFLNAAACEWRDVWGARISCQQYFFPYAHEIGAAPEIPNGPFDAVFLAAPKNMTETQYMIARGLGALKEGGIFFCAAANDAGGGRLEKLCEEAGLENIHDASKNKARVVWGVKMKDAPSAWIDAGAPRKIGDFWTQAGIFGWDKIDLGSKLLVENLEGLKGAGADFGCGYGYLARAVVEKCPDVKSLTCVDADWRAVQMCEKNLERFSGEKNFIWDDLTAPRAKLKNLDFIVMNPPFHEGKKTDSDIGISFIETAARSLRKGGVLWMVANARLPYEATLDKLFSKVEKTAQRDGFKILKAIA